MSFKNCSFVLTLNGRGDELSAGALAPSVSRGPGVRPIDGPLPPVPNDPFTSGPFLYSKQVDAYYSVGPDKTDDKTAVKFDASNGTMSKGDIWLEQ